MAMALNRDRQLRAQAEIDTVIGGDRLPVINDRKDLPYVNAVMKETMRWQPAVPMGELMCSRYSSRQDVSLWPAVHRRGKVLSQGRMLWRLSHS